MSTIDLNSDLGEGFGRWTLGDDAAMLGIVTSANIACGFHAGDPLVIRETVLGARDAGVYIGAHVGYRDLAGFGRRNMDVSSAELVADVIYQVGALQGIARAAGTTVTYVKPHGALYNTIVHDARQALDVVTAIREIDPTLAVLGLPGSEVLRAADAAGLRSVTEAFADRAYTPEGTLVSRREPGSVLHDAEQVAARMVQLATEGTLTAIDGSTIRVSAESICVHGDSPGATEMAAHVRRALTAASIDIAAFAPRAGETRTS
ncbi:LamB/YcsF family protein [Cryobacterium adonitolivorans]|uniref:5-oxoprolinase subunit A n=1 Tax=Cryobacterium adonitolivorans TaxID=1259189 RepID=A0A4R8WB27_9MICO|nr:5-oxoprolinase subunit PxpA [Cryobacterium adonitolivorans]TFC04083.1 LamB/YcsF family protein [Cryobacterium adonitolivorans]